MNCIVYELYLNKTVFEKVVSLHLQKQDKYQLNKEECQAKGN